jgi:hypothetical protein
VEEATSFFFLSIRAYVSWIFGQLAQLLHPELVDLRASRGHESEIGKVWKRLGI